MTRRGLIGGALALAAPALLLSQGQALATEADVMAAILEDFGTIVVPDGDISIDMPDFSDSGRSVPLTLEIPCSMQGLDYPEKVSVYAARNPRPRVCQVSFTPDCASAWVSTRIRIDAYQDIIVVARMADGRLFRAVRKVDVTYGACEDAIANDQFPEGWEPGIRLAVPKTAAPGEPVEIRTIIAHPMETGLRHDNRGLLIPVRIAESFRCFLEDRLVFSAGLEPAIAANPYFAFRLQARASGDLRFEWTDTTGQLYTATAQLVVG